MLQDETKIVVSLVYVIGKGGSMNNITLQISNLTWKIKKVPQGSPHLISDGVICYGVCNPDTLEIYIQGTDLNKQLYKSYLIHELTHAYIFSMGFSYKIRG